MPDLNSSRIESLLSAMSLYRRVSHIPLPHTGLRQSEMHMLLVLNKFTKENEPGMKVSDLSREIRVASPTITQFVNSLESMGYVERNPDPNDRRAVRIALTEKGRACTQSADDKLLALHNGLLDNLGEEDSAEFIRLLNAASDYFIGVRRDLDNERF